MWEAVVILCRENPSYESTFNRRYQMGYGIICQTYKKIVQDPPKSDINERLMHLERQMDNVVAIQENMYANIEFGINNLQSLPRIKKCGMVKESGAQSQNEQKKEDNRKSDRKMLKKRVSNILHTEPGNEEAVKPISKRLRSIRRQ